MSNEIRLLIVEDNDNEQLSWIAQLRDHNAKAQETGGVGYRHTFAKSREEAQGLIDRNYFDAAIVDLGLDQGQDHKIHNADGNDVALALAQSELAVLIIFTGQPTTAQIVKDIGPKVQVITKGMDGDCDGTERVMKILHESVPMILAVRSAQESIKSEMAVLFHKSIWPRWQLWVDEKAAPDEEVSAAISRHLVSHVYSSLLEKNKQQVFSEEWYFVPPIRAGLRTGDLVEVNWPGEVDPQVGVVITPRCDLAGNEGKKNETYQVALCVEVSTDWKIRSDTFDGLSAARPMAGANKHLVDEWDGKFKSAQQKLNSFVGHSGNTSNYHFLHQMKRVGESPRGPYFVRFDKIISLQRTSNDGTQLEQNRIASIAPEFLPSLVERLGAYFSRIGTPAYSHNE